MTTSVVGNRALGALISLCALAAVLVVPAQASAVERARSCSREYTRGAEKFELCAAVVYDERQPYFYVEGQGELNVITSDRNMRLDIIQVCIQRQTTGNAWSTIGCDDYPGSAGYPTIGLKSWSTTHGPCRTNQYYRGWVEGRVRWSDGVLSSTVSHGSNRTYGGNHDCAPPI